MTNEQVGWIVLIYFAMFLIVIGIQGNLGTTIAILFTPKYVTLEGEPTPTF